MVRKLTSGIVTANRLLEGDVVYLSADGTWTPALQNATLLRDEAMVQACLDKARMQGDQVIDPYLIAAETDSNGQLRPARYREILRANGPTNYRHGKQAES